MSTTSLRNNEYCIRSIRRVYNCINITLLYIELALHFSMNYYSKKKKKTKKLLEGAVVYLDRHARRRRSRSIELLLTRSRGACQALSLSRSYIDTLYTREKIDLVLFFRRRTGSCVCVYSVHSPVFTRAISLFSESLSPRDRS